MCASVETAESMALQLDKPSVADREWARIFHEYTITPPSYAAQPPLFPLDNMATHEQNSQAPENCLQYTGVTGALRH